ncbi:hypothetical protein BRO54_2752 [Geobacillus proteiniphilus]|uniref:Uncharacterized protein n=1 Tax=Geobacillus proteiniphilus TaxID=860353 RepID=A0A1Q5STL3_9BACL|nr:hypothetical protein BRO54_2752 [Geobacillus proteiniphilus]
MGRLFLSASGAAAEDEASSYRLGASVSQAVRRYRFSLSAKQGSAARLSKYKRCITIGRKG